MNAVSTTNLCCRLWQSSVRYIVVALRLAAIVTAILLLAAIVYCALAPSSYMTEIPFIPSWLGTWADANPNFRNMPVFAALAALLFFVVTFYQRLVTRYSWWQLATGAFLAAAALGAALEVAQTLIPGRWADPLDVIWSSAGAFVGAFGSVKVKTFIDIACRTRRKP